MGKIYIKNILLFLTILISISCSENANILQVKNWEILFEQGEFNEILKYSEWKEIEIPSQFYAPYIEKREFRSVWLRGDFEITGDPDYYAGLSTGRIKFSDKIYINNQIIGKTRPEKVNWSPTPRNYLIPPGLLKKGLNKVYIQLGIYGKYKGGIANDVIIQGEDDFERTWFYNDLMYKHLPFLLLVFFAVFAAALFVVFIINKKEKLPLYTLLGLLVYVLYMATLLPWNRSVTYETYLAILMFIIPLFSITLILFIQAIYRIFLISHNRIIIPILLLLVIIMVLFRDSGLNIQVGLITTILSLIFCVPYLVFLIYRLNAIHPDKFLRNTMFSMSLIVVFIIIFEFYYMYTGSYYSDFMAKTSPIVFLVIFAAIFHREILKRQIELDFLYKKLKAINPNEKERAITSSSQEKLKQVIDFINENFTSDISREGLAAAIGMNPNYMGSIFKTFTGKTINEYINNKRILEAIELIEEGDSRIIDIAFSVGFENIVTFNRVFKKVTGKTPSEYK